MIEPRISREILERCDEQSRRGGSGGILTAAGTREPDAGDRRDDDNSAGAEQYARALVRRSTPLARDGLRRRSQRVER